MDLSLHGQTKDALDKTKAGSWEYDIVSPAYKCNMTDIQAAMGLAQLMRYQSMLKRRHEIISRYDDAFKNENVSVLEHTGENHVPVDTCISSDRQAYRRMRETI